MVFYENEFYQNNQAQICTEAFQYPGKRFLRRNNDIERTFTSKRKPQFSISEKLV